MKQCIWTVVFICFTVVFLGCGYNGFEQRIQETIGKKIILNVDSTNQHEFTILRYVQNPSCTSCQLKLGEWRVYTRRMQRMFGNKVSFRFICETNNTSEAEHLFKLYNFENISTVDSTIKFYDEHNINESLGKDVVFLLDSTSTILSIGNPIENTGIGNLYHRIISGEINN